MLPASEASVCFVACLPLSACNAWTNPTAKALDEPKPVLPGMSEKVVISIGKSILNNLSASRTIGCSISSIWLQNSTSIIFYNACWYNKSDFI